MKDTEKKAAEAAEYEREEAARMESWKKHMDGYINYGDHRNIWEHGKEYGAAWQRDQTAVAVESVVAKLRSIAVYDARHNAVIKEALALLDELKGAK